MPNITENDKQTLEAGETLWSITGASGYVGSRLADRLRARGARVRGLHRDGAKGRSEDFICGDVGSPEVVRRLVTGADVVVHLAAYVHRRAETKEEKEACYRTNVIGTKVLIEAVAECAPDAFFVFVSSANVYPTSEDPLDENTKPEPRSFYGKTKLEAELALLDATREGRIKGVILRPPLVFGVGGPGNLARLISILRRRLLPTLNGGRNLKSVVPVETLVDAIIGVSDKRTECCGEVFNVAGDTMTLRRVAEVISDELGVRPFRIPLPATLARWIATIGDGICRSLRLPTPNLEQLVETYTASTVISDAKLRRIIPLPEADVVEAAIRETVRATCRGERLPEVSTAKSATRGESRSAVT